MRSTDSWAKPNSCPHRSRRRRSTASERIGWLDDNQAAEVEEYEEKQKELEGVAMRIMQQLYAGGAPGYRDKCDEVAAAGYRGMVLE